jgi:cob(I)alamin adenosyltransferase
MAAVGQTSWTIGELARSAGVTVRTLHHYDQLGLLRPSARTESGHRRYDAHAVARLYRILALRSLGLGLGDLPSLLDDGPERLRATVQLQRQRVDEQLHHFEQLRARLDAVTTSLDRSSEPPATDLLDTLETMTMTVHLRRIYTRLGDNGETDLADRSRVSKTDPHVEAGGTVDELNTAIGVALATAGELPDKVGIWLRQIQNDLFDLGASLSRIGDDPEAPECPIDERDVAWLESICDEANAGLPALPSFVLPGGTSLAAHLHTCRAVCRRAERRVLAVPEAPVWIVRYLNRLSDVFFILSRLANVGGEELLWQPRSRRVSTGGRP